MRTPTRTAFDRTAVMSVLTAVTFGLAAAVWLAGCGGDDTTPAPTPGSDVASVDAEVSQPDAGSADPDIATPEDVGPDAGPADVGSPPPELPPTTSMEGVLHAAISLDVTALTGQATLRVVRPAGTDPLTLEAGGLTITAVTAGGAPLEYTHEAGTLSITVPAGEGPAEVMVEYGFATVGKGTFEGYMVSGSTLLWPYHCGNLYPCRSHPADGLTFSLEVSGVPAGQMAVHAATVDADAPAYSVAFAVGEYSYESVGTTAAGTEIGYWALPDTADAATKGTEHLVGVVEWLEQTLGPYSFGAKMGPVAVQWGPLAYGGIEHHPYWHVSTAAMGDIAVHAHEAAHGWYGNGVRLECWEDLVLSEGTANYLAARSIEQVVGAEQAEEVWTDYDNRLQQLVSFGLDHVAWPATCDPAFDVIEDGLFSQIPYLKGAFFFREVAETVGADVLDGILSDFYIAHRNHTGRMQALLDRIQDDTGFDPGALSDGWLKAEGIPAGGE